MHQVGKVFSQWRTDFPIHAQIGAHLSDSRSLRRKPFDDTLNLG